MHPNQLIHDYNQIKSYQRYYRRVSSCEMDNVETREGLTSHQRPHCADEVYYPRLHVDILPSIVALHVRLVICSSSGLRLHGAPTNCKDSQAIR